jgi:hypothetical protein
MASRIDDPVYAESVAKLLSEGLSHEEVAAALGDGTHKDTVRGWAKNPKIQAIRSRLTAERVNRVTAKLDKIIEGRLSDKAALEAMDMKDLVALRRELLGPAAQRVVVHRGADEAQATMELMKVFAGNPELAAAMGAEGIAETYALEAGDEEDDVPEQQPGDAGYP